MSATVRQRLEELYRTTNRREYVRPDPLELLYCYNDVRDREIAALVASSLAYGRVALIVRNAGSVLDRMGAPTRFLRRASKDRLRRSFDGFRHRFATGAHLSALLLGAKRAIKRHGSLEACFAAGLDRHDENVLPALASFTRELRAEGACGHLLPSPDAGSACKRLNLFLRWMVRHDEVDPGGWETVRPDKLIVPLDVHMQRICRALGLTTRKSNNARTAVEITAAFKRFAPDDPVKYDFALTRLALRKDGDLDGLPGDILAGGPCACDEVGEALRRCYADRKLFLVPEHNGLMTNSRYQASLMGLTPVNMVPLHPPPFCLDAVSSQAAWPPGACAPTLGLNRPSRCY